MRTAVLFLLAAGSAAAAPVPKHLMRAADDTEQGKLQGRWKLESLRIGDMRLGGADLKMVMEFRGDEMTAVVNQGGEQRTTGKVKFDATDGVKRLTLTNTRQAGPGGAPGPQPDASFGYLLDGDTLTLASRVGVPGGPGGQAVDPAKPDNATAVFVLTREKPDPGR